MSFVHLGISFFVELFILLIEFSKVMFWTIFYFVFSPTEKNVRNEIVLITGSARGLGIRCWEFMLNKLYCIIYYLFFFINKGRQLAIEFAKRGSILALLDLDDAENAKTVEILKTAGLNSKRIYAYHCDLRYIEFFLLMILI